MARSFLLTDWNARSVVWQKVKRPLPLRETCEHAEKICVLGEDSWPSL